MLIDEIQVIFKAGNGGNGKMSFGKMLKSGPDGGNGGDGGDLYIKAASDLTLLNQFSAKSVWEAPNGVHGGKTKMFGGNGKDLTILLPVGTNIKDLDTGEEWDLKKTGQEIFLCKGGKGGKGNWELRSSVNTTPLYAQKGEPGQKRNLQLTLKLIADYGLIGLPNAGKSSLLKELTNANPKIANYAFTTLSPNLGVWDGKIIADVPGLIEGAHEGKGLGIRFLKHIEKVGLLLHCISCQSQNISKDYETIRQELGSYKKSLLRKKEVILLTKTDLVESSEIKAKIKDLSKFSDTVIPVSIHDFESIENVKKMLK
jgi:GTPase